MNDKELIHELKKCQKERDDYKEEVQILCNCLNGSTKAVYDADGFDLATADLRRRMKELRFQRDDLNLALVGIIDMITHPSLGCDETIPEIARAKRAILK